MRVQRRLLLSAIVIAPISALSALFTLSAKAEPRFAPEPIGRPADATVMEGVGSCASSNCHGSLARGASELRSAVTLWTRDDPHAQAWFTLRSERSRTMLASLRGLESPKDAHPENDELCLKCHAMSVEKSLQGLRFDHTEGVGCESCHGAAGNWKTKHDLPAWQFMSDAEKGSYGMKALRNPAIRAEVCAGCHQGSPDHEVNHDLIGAGHPALFFDVSAQMDRLPHHWSPAIDRQYPDFSAKLWVAGELMGTRMSMKNLEARASDEKKPWPEFSEYDCLACHRPPLLDPLPRPTGVRPGQAPYMGWGQSMTRILTQQGRFADAELPKLLDGLAAEMNKPYPDRAKVAKQAAEIHARIGNLSSRVGDTSFTKNDIAGLMRTIATDESRTTAARWYNGVQVTSGLIALDKALSQLDPAPRPDVQAALANLRKIFPVPVDRGWMKEPQDPKPLAPFLAPLLDQRR